MNDNEYDASAIWRKTDEKLKDFYFSDAVINETTFFFYLKNRPFKWNNYEELKGVKIGTTIGYSYGDEFDSLNAKKFFMIEETSTDKQNFLKLLYGRIQLFPVELSAPHASTHVGGNCAGSPIVRKQIWPKTGKVTP